MHPASTHGAIFPLRIAQPATTALDSRIVCDGGCARKFGDVPDDLSVL
jgi:hypothetical protein